MLFRSLYRHPGPLPPNILAGRVTTWRRGGRWVHDKGLARGRGPRQGEASLKLKSHRPNWAVVGTAEVRGAAHGDVRLGALLYVVSLSRKWQGREPPLLGAALLTALYTRTATAARASPRADAQSPCALCRGGRDSFARKEPSRGQGASRGSAWSLAESEAAFVMPSRGEAPREGKALARLARLREPGP